MPDPSATPATAAAPKQGASGPLVVLVVLLIALSCALFATLLAFNTRHAVHVRALHERLTAVEAQLGIESAPLPSRDDRFTRQEP